MSCGIVLFIIALFTILIGIALAFCIPVFIPRHFVDSDYEKSVKGDKPWDIRERCNCLNSLEIEDYVHSTRKAEVEYSEGWRKAYPSIVSILAKKYVDDPDNLYFDFQCTAVILDEERVIAGKKCYKVLDDCRHKSDKNEDLCISQLRIRSHSQYWSAGGELRGIKRYQVQKHTYFIILFVEEHFTFKKGLKPVDYPGTKSVKDRHEIVGWVVEPYGWKYAISQKRYYNVCPQTLEEELEHRELVEYEETDADDVDGDVLSSSTVEAETADYDNSNNRLDDVDARMNFDYDIKENVDTAEKPDNNTKETADTEKKTNDNTEGTKESDDTAKRINAATGDGDTEINPDDNTKETGDAAKKPNDNTEGTKESDDTAKRTNAVTDGGATEINPDDDTKETGDAAKKPNDNTEATDDGVTKLNPDDNSKETGDAAKKPNDNTEATDDGGTKLNPDDNSKETGDAAKKPNDNTEATDDGGTKLNPDDNTKETGDAAKKPNDNTEATDDGGTKLNPDDNTKETGDAAKKVNDNTEGTDDGGTKLNPDDNTTETDDAAKKTNGENDSGDTEINQGDNTNETGDTAKKTNAGTGGGDTGINPKKAKKPEETDGGDTKINSDDNTKETVDTAKKPGRLYGTDTPKKLNNVTNIVPAQNNDTAEEADDENEPTLEIITDKPILTSHNELFGLDASNGIVNLRLAIFQKVINENKVLQAFWEEHVCLVSEVDSSTKDDKKIDYFS